MKKIFTIFLLCFFAMQVNAQPTYLLKDINPGPGNSNAKFALEVNGITFFSALTSATGHELWKTNGKPVGTEMVKDIIPGVKSSNPRPIGKLTITTRQNTTISKLFFAADLNDSTEALYASDGTSAGTVALTSGYPKRNVHTPKPVIYAGKLYMPVRNSIYSSDGTPQGTFKVVTVTDSITAIDANTRGLFFLTRKNTLRTLYASNGTQAGTVSLKTSSMDISMLMKPTICFAIITNFYDNTQIFRTNGTVVGTQLIAFGSTISYPVLAGNFIYYFNNNASNKTLYRANENTVEIVKNFVTSSNYSIMGAGDDVYLTSRTGAAYEIWKSDGTEAGTRFVKQIALPIDNPATTSLSFLGYNNGKIFIRFYGGNIYWRLIVSDGTEAGTKILDQIYSWIYERPFISNNIFYFVAEQRIFLPDTNFSFSGIHKSDGTESGTLRVDLKTDGAYVGYIEPMTYGLFIGIFNTNSSTIQTGDEPHILPNCATGNTPQIVSQSVAPNVKTLSVSPLIGIGPNKKWYWYAGSSCSGTAIDSGQSITRTISASSSFSVRGEGGCTVNSNCASITIEPSSSRIARNAAPEKTSEHLPASLKIYPNPARQQITIEANKTETALLLNSQAVVVQQLKLRQGGNSVNIHHLPAGMYLVKTASGQTQRFEIIK